MRQTLHLTLLCFILATAQAQPARVVNANIDYAASGYVTPAGMVAPAMYSGVPPMSGNPAMANHPSMMGNPLMHSSVPGLDGGYGGISQVAMSQSVHGCGNPASERLICEEMQSALSLMICLS